MENEILNKETMSSLQIAEITGKSHSNVMRDVRNLLGQGVNQINFELVEYTDAKGENRPCYNLTKKGCLILASGYDALLREKIINRWEELEKKEQVVALPKDYISALRALADAEEKKQQLALENKELAPKAEYTDKVLQSDNTYTFTQVAKSLNMKSAIELGMKLIGMRVMFKQSGQYQLMSRYSGLGYTQTRTHQYVHNGEIGTSTRTVWTEKGRLFLHNLLTA